MTAEKKISTEVQSPFLQSCDISLDDFKVGPFTMVIFGGAGDLSTRKLLPSLYHLFCENLIQSFSILGFARTKLSTDEYRKVAHDAIKTFSPDMYDVEKCSAFCENLFFEQAHETVDGTYDTLSCRVTELCNRNKCDNLIYYLAVPPEAVPPIIDRLAKLNLCRSKANAKIVIEKPFGRDKKSAEELNNCILKAFNEKQVYRIDHYLGKESVQNILFFRFTNTIFEPVWNRDYINHVQITVAEEIGIENRGVFYEQAGILQDIIQNHMMQLIALVAMEPPVGMEADYVRDEKIKVVHELRKMDDSYIDLHTVAGQYAEGDISGKAVNAYRREKNVSPSSCMPTYFAGTFYIDNWRWSGVPFYVRSGKRLAKRTTQISIEFKYPPLKLFGRTCDNTEPNTLVFNIQPQQEISLQFSVKYPGQGNRTCPVDMLFNYEKIFNTKRNPDYERLLIDCIKGDLMLFARQDGILAMWDIVDPIIARWEKTYAEDIPLYTAGSMGPKGADKLLEKDGRLWRPL